MIKEILAVMGGALGMIFKFIFIIAFSLGGVYCFGTMFMFPFFWEGLGADLSPVPTSLKSRT